LISNLDCPCCTVEGAASKEVVSETDEANDVRYYAHRVDCVGCGSIFLSSSASDLLFGGNAIQPNRAKLRDLLAAGRGRSIRDPIERSELE
jgi:hypothetical protein